MTFGVIEVKDKEGNRYHERDLKYVFDHCNNIVSSLYKTNLGWTFKINGESSELYDDYSIMSRERAIMVSTIALELLGYNSDKIEEMMVSEEISRLGTARQITWHCLKYFNKKGLKIKNVKYHMKYQKEYSENE